MVCPCRLRKAIKLNIDEDGKVDMEPEEASDGSLSRPFDKALGHKADPEGGKIYDKRSA